MPARSSARTSFEYPQRVLQGARQPQSDHPCRVRRCIEYCPASYGTCTRCSQHPAFRSYRRCSRVRDDDQLLREHAYTHGDLAVVRLRLAKHRPAVGFCCFIVNSHRCSCRRSRLGAGEEIDADPSEHFATSMISVLRYSHDSKVHTFVLSPRILVSPMYETFIDPSEQRYRGICESICEGLWGG